MNEALRLTAIYVRDLLEHPESLITIGRLGEDIEDFNADYIGIDALSAATRLASGKDYNGDVEQMTYTQQLRIPVTVTFYGANGWGNATKFSLLTDSQKSYELQRSLGIGVMQPSGVTDVKILAGLQYGERYEVTVNVIFTLQAIVDILRIDVARYELLTEYGWEVEV